MDDSPLVKAHDHALAASKATRSSDTTVAISHHALAAGEFANAAQSTTSIEALRTLNLLEQHHRRLSELLKFPADQQPSHASSDAETDADEKQTSGPSKEAPSAIGDATPKTDKAGGAGPKAQVPSLLGQRRQPPRELSSSIASNLASARGIRVKYAGQPLSPSVSSDPASGAVETLPRRRDGSRTKMQNMLDQPPKPVWAAPGPAQQEHQAPRNQRDAETSQDDALPGGGEQAEDGYSRFYNSFGSLFSKLSAPLAFAGLPLIAEEASASQEALAPPPEPTSPKRARSRHHGQHHHGAPTTAASTVSATGEPDLHRIYSKAALRVISRDGHYQASDSFYVVPPSGHTMSYASILSFAEKEKRRMEASTHSHSHAGGALENDEDDFVDARETPVPPAYAAATGNLSAVARRRVGPRARTERDLNNAIEELVVENKSLKDMLDKLSKRLHAFEASAQKSSLALAESMRFMRPGSPLASASGSGGSAGGAGGGAAVSAEMEEKLAAAMKHIEALEKDNQKMQKTLVKYRDKWEQLKETAKARRGQVGTAGMGTEAGSPLGETPRK